MFLQDERITVTNARIAVVGGTTYATANITSVRTFVEPRPAGYMALGAILGTIAVVCLWSQVWVLGASLSFFAALSFRAYSRERPKYWVRLATAGAEVGAVWSNDERWTNGAVSAVLNAIAAR